MVNRKDYWGIEHDERFWSIARNLYFGFDLILWIGVIVGSFTGEWLAVCAFALVGIAVELSLIKHGGPS